MPRIRHDLFFVASLFLMAWLVSGTLAEAQSNSETEQQLLAVLRSDAPAAEKAITCKRLAIHGSSRAVPELAQLLLDPRLSSWARIALEAIPGEAADKALRQATHSLEGKLLIGTINSIGVRRDAAAVDLLTTLLGDADPGVASAAAVALGKIGNPAAAKSLRSALAGGPQEVRSAVAEGCVLCAEQFHAAGQSATAVEIYDAVRQAKVPKQRILEATRGAILARGEDGIPMLVKLLKSPDKKMFQLGLSTAREFPGAELDKALASVLDEAAPQRAAFVIVAMADRQETVVLPAVIRAVGKGPKPVRLAALAALGRVGDESCVSTLLQAAIEPDADVTAAAKESLAALKGKKVDAQIAALLPDAEGKSRRLLVELVGRRRIPAADELLKALDDSDQQIRRAALSALGETVALKQLPVLISQVVDPQHPEDSAAAQRALRIASVRMPDREACAEELSAALARSPAAAKGVLLEILAEVGGDKALQRLATAAKSDEPVLQDTASRLLGKWNSLNAAPVLLDLASTAPESKYRIRALRGYIGLARKFAMPEPQRVAMCRKALEAASQRPNERKLVLEVLKLRPSAAGLALALEVQRDPELKQAATETVLVIAKKISGKRSDLSKLLAGAGLAQVNLEIVKAEYGAGSTFQDVTAALRRHAGDLPLITLPDNSYNIAFGGDPVPGKVKRLRIQYTMDGKSGEASFAENALIILPMPR